MSSCHVQRVAWASWPPLRTTIWGPGTRVDARTTAKRGEQEALSAEGAGDDGRGLDRPARLVEGAHPPHRRGHLVAEGLDRQDLGLVVGRLLGGRRRRGR